MAEGDRTVYRDERFLLCFEEGAPTLWADGRRYALSCHPAEPCTCLRGENGLTVIHNAFDPAAALELFSGGGSIGAVTGKVYGPRDFCLLLAFAAEHNADTDIGWLEGALAVERLKALGATAPERAVSCEELGVRAISERFSRSKKRRERVMYTEDGRVYLRIKQG